MRRKVEVNKWENERREKNGSGVSNESYEGRDNDEILDKKTKVTL